MIDRNKPILVTGAYGMVGAATVNLLKLSSFSKILAPTRAHLDLEDSESVNIFFKTYEPAYVLMVGALVGGIAANISDPVGFADKNLRMVLNLFSACHKFGVKKCLFLGSSCIYPSGISELIAEERLLTGLLEPTNEGYALSKIVGLKLAKYYKEQYALDVVCPMPCNIYGTGDHFDFERAHVLSSLVRRFVDAVDGHADFVTLWGNGEAKREFIHSTDVARAILYFMDEVNTSAHINIGFGKDISIFDLAYLIAGLTNFKGKILWDQTKPTGIPRKCLDVTKMREIGFSPIISLESGLKKTIAEYKLYKTSKSI
jgi:GDP-L-fucose synthase